ncbi:MAG: hypothetical protein J4F39_13625 [Candidatus Latescibacteria bacterium]|nr:hypothetical protein [Candidatus Latescibacterota bacterium]
MNTRMLDQTILDDIIQRIKEGADALDLMGQIYRKLHGAGAAVDAIVDCRFVTSNRLCSC